MDTKVDQIKKIINAPDNVIRACLLKHQESVDRALDELLQGKLMVTFFGLEAMGEFTLLGFHRVQKRKHCECFRKSKVFIDFPLRRVTFGHTYPIDVQYGHLPSQQSQRVVICGKKIFAGKKLCFP